MPNIVRRSLIVLGVMAFVGGPLFGLVLADRWDGVPTALPAQQVAEGRGEYLSPDHGYRVIGPVQLRNVHRLTRRAAPAGSAALLWVARDRTEDLDHGRVVDHSTTTYALDPRTAGSLDCCGLGSSRKGSLTQAFPPRTEARSYPWWDGTAERVVTARFAGNASLDDVRLYAFTVRVDPIVIDRVEVPGAAVGSSAHGPVALDWWYSSTTRLLVEPHSGVIVRGTQAADQWLADRAGKRRLTVATTTFTDTPATVRANLAVAKQARAVHDARRTWPVLVGPMLAMAFLAAVAVRWDDAPEPTPAADRSAEEAPARRRRPIPVPTAAVAWQPAGPGDLLERRPA